MKLHHLRDVIAVAERGSLRAAARHLGVAQPSLTRSISELERELGAALFERQATGMQVTAIGSRFIERAGAVQSELKRARDEVAQMRGQAQGSVRMCLSSVPHIALLPEAIGPFRARFPRVHMDIAEGVFPTIEVALRNGSLDCYIGPPPAQPAVDGLLIEKLFDNRRVIVCRKGHPLAHARSLKELVDAEWMTTSITYRAEEEVGPLFTQHGLPAPRLAMQARSSLTFVVTLQHTDLLMILPVQWLDSPLVRDALQVIAIREPLPTPPICIVRRAGLPLTPAAEYFCDMIRRAAARQKTVESALPRPEKTAKPAKGAPPRVKAKAVRKQPRP